MATQKGTARKAPAKKAPAKRKAAATNKAKSARKAPAKKPVDLTLKDRAQQGVNVYLGLWGAGYDLMQENLEYARNNKLRMKELEKRGEKLRKEFRKNLDKLEIRELDQMFDSVQGQLDKLQKKLDELAKEMKSRVRTTRNAA